MEHKTSDTNSFDIHRDLVDSCLAGNTKSYEELYKLYSKAMFNVAYRIIRDLEDAEDVLQESFIRAFKKLESYKGDASFGAWLKRIVINNSINFIRKNKMDYEDVESHAEIPADHNESLYIDSEHKVSQVREAIEQLPDGYRVVFSLYMLEGYDHSEIAEILGISESTSKSQLNRSKKKLREIIFQNHGKEVN